MELDWSAQSPHIRSLFHPWQPGDGYDEETIQTAEVRLGVRLPATLRNFYKAWGRRRDLAKPMHLIVDPEDLMVRADTLIFCVENQAVCYWGIRSEVLEEDDPPVVTTESTPLGWDIESELNWIPSYVHLVGFLDDLIYLQAFHRGAAYGGHTGFGFPPLPEQHMRWLEEHWNKASVGALFFGRRALDAEIDNSWPSVYVRDGKAFFQLPGRFANVPGFSYSLVAREAEALDEISQRFEITWENHWQTGAVNNLIAIEHPEHIEVFPSNPPITQRWWL